MKQVIIEPEKGPSAFGEEKKTEEYRLYMPYYFDADVTPTPKTAGRRLVDTVDTLEEALEYQKHYFERIRPHTWIEHVVITETVLEVYK
jgi:hypothetical protein